MSGKDEIPGAVTRETTIRRINEWYRPLLDSEKNSEECFELPKLLQGQTAKGQSGVEYWLRNPPEHMAGEFKKYLLHYLYSCLQDPV
jgi:hypothetical protein